jgi:hypothetical protein
MTMTNAVTQPAADEFAGRLGLRVKEFSRAYGIPMPTVWRRIRQGDINVVRIGAVAIITRAELQRLGLIS